MKLHHRMLRHFIAASVIVLTSSFLIFELVASDRAMSAYLRYIVQKAGNDSNLLIVFYVQIMPDDFVMQLHRF